MATELFTFGVKYRLDIGDVEGADWRIDIEEKDYAGSVNSFIGDGTAFEITWENNEDYSKAIIGSYCRINIMAKPILDVGTPSFTDLFTIDENKFRVKIYYDDGGYQLYWQGFIVQDEYVEEINSDPYKISVIATENFGKLKRFPYKDNDPSLHEEYDTPATILYESLTKIGLAIDVYDLSGLYVLGQQSLRGTGSARPYCEQIEVASENYLRGDTYTDYYDYYQIVDSYLKSINCYMIQALGELYIISKASYHSVISGNFDWEAYKLTFGASSFSSASFSSASLPINLGVDVPSDLRVLDRSLIKTRRSANQQVLNNYRIKLRNLFFNGSFELDQDINTNVKGWYESITTALVYTDLDFTTVDGGVTTTNSTLTGNRSYLKSVSSKLYDDNFLAASEGDANSIYTIFATDSEVTQDSASNVIQKYPIGVPYEQNHSSGDPYVLDGRLSFKLYFTNDCEAPINVRYSLFHKGAVDKYYDFENDEWTSAFNYGTKVIETKGKWEEVSETISFPVADALQLSSEGVILRIHSISQSVSGTPTGSYYLDDVRLEVAQPEGSEDAVTSGTNSFIAQVENDEQYEGAETSTTSVIGGITRFNFDGTYYTPSSLQERNDLMLGLIDSQYVDESYTSGLYVRYALWWYDRDPATTSPYSPRPLALQQWVAEHRYDEASVTQDFIEGNLKNITATTGTYTPITPLDTLLMSFRSGAYDTKHYNIVRMSFNPRLNLINFVGKNVIETQGSYSVP